MSNASSPVSGHFRRRPSHPSASRNQLARSLSVLARRELCCAFAALRRYSSSLSIVGSNGCPASCGSFENTWDQKRVRPPPIPVSNTSTVLRPIPKFAQSSVFNVTRKQFDHLSGLGKRQFRPQEGSEFLNDPMPLQVNLPSDGIAIEPNDMNGVTRHPAGHPADVRRSLDIQRLAIPIDLV